MTITLYGHPISTCSKRVITVLKEKQIPFDFVTVNFAAGEHKSPEYLKNQPFGQIPYLKDGDFVIFESRAICRYLENKFKNQGTQLIPSDPQAYGLFEQGASIEQANFDPQASGLAFERMFKQFQGKTADEDRVKQLSEKLGAVLDVYETILSKQKYIGGNDVTLADLFHLPYGALLFAPQLNLGNLITDRAQVKAWWESLSSRQSWKDANEQK